MLLRLVKIAQRQQSRGPLFASVDPSGTFFYYWTILVLLMLMYNLIVCPIMVFEEFARDYYNQWLCLNLFSDFINFCDLFVQSKRVFHKNGVLISDPYEVLQHYLHKKVFVLDVLAILPVDFLLIVWPKMSLLRLNRLLKGYRVNDFTKQTEIHTSAPNLFRLIRLVLVCFSMFHYNACFYYLFSLIYYSPDATLDDWIYAPSKIPNLRYPDCDARYNVGTCTMNENNIDFWHRELYIDRLVAFYVNRFKETDFRNLTRKYGLSFYWSALTLTTLGEQPWPNNSVEMCFEICNTLVGLTLFAIILGDIGSMVTNMNYKRTNFEELRDACKKYIQFRKVEHSISKRIMNYLDFNRLQGNVTNDEDIAKILPRCLYNQLISSAHLDALKKVSLFRDCESGVLEELIQCLQLRIFGPGEFVCYKNEIGKKMYMVKSGHLQVLNDAGNVVLQVLEKNAVFGEIFILDLPGSQHQNRYNASVRSVGYSTLYVLTKDDLLKVINDHPNQHRQLIQKAKQLLQSSTQLDYERLAQNRVDFAARRFHRHLTVEDRLSKVSASVRQLDEFTTRLDWYCHTTFNQLKQRLMPVELKFTKLVEKSNPYQLKIKHRRSQPHS